MLPEPAKKSYRGSSLTILLLCILIVLLVAHIVFDFHQQHQNRVWQGQTVFQRMISEAAQVRPEYISSDLLAVDPGNPELVFGPGANTSHIKVAAWMSEKDFARHYEELVGKERGAYTPPENPILWVTLVPQVQNFCRQFMRRSNDPERTSAAFRLKQYLGLNPHRAYVRFVELWVKPDDLFRPCPDPETNDTACNLTLDLQHPPQVKNVADYPAFFRQLVADSYAADGAPWTRLGYTFDWARAQRNVGASEYMLVPQAHYLVANSYSTEAYCRP